MRSAEVGELLRKRGLSQRVGRRMHSWRVTFLVFAAVVAGGVQPPPSRRRLRRARLFAWFRWTRSMIGLATWCLIRLQSVRSGCGCYCRSVSRRTRTAAGRCDGPPAWETFHLTELIQVLECDWRASDHRAVAGSLLVGWLNSASAQRLTRTGPASTTGRTGNGNCTVRCPASCVPYSPDLCERNGPVDRHDHTSNTSPTRTTTAAAQKVRADKNDGDATAATSTEESPTLPERSTALTT
jgi:hypothetical protein